MFIQNDINDLKDKASKHNYVNLQKPFQITYHGSDTLHYNGVL